MSVAVPENPSHDAVNFPEFSEADFRELIAKIEQANREMCETHVPGLYPALDAYYGLLKTVIPDWVISASYQVIAFCWEALEALTNLVVKILDGALVPVTAAIRWAFWSGESAACGATDSNLTTATDAVWLTWSGEAAKAYALHAKQQGDRIKAFKSFCEFQASTMMSVCGLAVTLYGSVAVEVVKTSGGAAAGLLSTPVDGPAGPLASLVAIGLGVLGISSGVALASSLISSLATQVSGQLSAMDALGATWPEPPGIGYKDGSASDGDRSDWSTERK